jgi:hypothetical protein
MEPTADAAEAFHFLPTPTPQLSWTITSTLIVPPATAPLELETSEMELTAKI